MRHIACATVIITALTTHATTVPAQQYVARGSEPYLRDGPGIRHDRVRRLERGEPVTLRGSENRWVEVRTERGESGWVRRSEIRDVR